MSCELLYSECAVEDLSLLHINDTPAAPPATGFDVKIHLFDTSNIYIYIYIYIYFFHVG